VVGLGGVSGDAGRPAARLAAAESPEFTIFGVLSLVLSEAWLGRELGQRRTDLGHLVHELEAGQGRVAAGNGK
jgi:hypothetical protein